MFDDFLELLELPVVSAGGKRAAIPDLYRWRKVLSA
jgi:hypothetical protein